MKNKTMAKIFTVAMLVLILASATSLVFAEGSGYFETSKYEGNQSDAADRMESASQRIIGIVQVVAMVIAVVILIYMGIKYVSAAPAEKADVKKGAMIYVVGAILLFSTAGVLQMVKGLGDAAFGNNTTN